jgi:hypothetical protein
LWRDIRIWLSLDHENVMPFLGWSEDLSGPYGLSSGSGPALISLFYENGNLEQYLKNKPDADKASIVSISFVSTTLLRKLVDLSNRPGS